MSLPLQRHNFGPHTAIGGDYATVYARTTQEADRIAKGEADEQLWIGHHPLTITLGRSLKAQGQVGVVPAHVPVVSVERGGGATLHNLGQVVAYPLMRLDRRNLSPVSYLRLLEEAIIAVLAEDNITAQAIAGQTGVWVGERKIASLGVSLINGVTRHGLAINVTNELNDFSLITPCGFSASVMTKVADYRKDASFPDYVERMHAALLSRLC